MKYQFIVQKQVRYSIENQCRVLAVSRAGYYQWRKRMIAHPQEIPRRQRENGELLERVRVLYVRYRKRYGSPRITRVLQQEGFRCSRNRVARLMRDDGLVARSRRRWVRTTVSDHRAASPNLLARRFRVLTPNTVWVCDITYVETREGWLYVATVMDLCTRKIIGLSMRADLTQELVMHALRQAIRRAKPAAGLMLHSDRGVQYSSGAYRAIIRAQGFRQSMSRKGNCWDNAPMESFFKTLKVELIYEHRYETRSDAASSIFDYIEIFYNRQRMHSALNFQTPDAFEATSNQSTTTAHIPKSPVY